MYIFIREFPYNHSAVHGKNVRLVAILVAILGQIKVLEELIPNEFYFIACDANCRPLRPTGGAGGRLL